MPCKTLIPGASFPSGSHVQVWIPIRAASTARLAKQAKQASRGTVPSRAPRIDLRRLFHPTLRRVS